jgi:hypothetical protein
MKGLFKFASAGIFAGAAGLHLYKNHAAAER